MNTSRTARDNPSSIVKRSFDQSTEAPMRRICSLIVLPDWCFQDQISLTNSWHNLFGPHISFFSVCLSLYLIPENELKIQEYNRVVTDLNGYSNKKFLEALKQHFNISPQDNGKTSYIKHSFSMYLKGQFYCVSLQNSTLIENSPL